MPGMTITKQIAAPVDKVFGIATDLRSAPGRIQKIVRLEVLTDGPVREGTRFRETRRMFNRESTEEMEVTAFEPSRRFAIGAESHGCRYRSEFLFSPESGGTKVVMSFEGTPLTFTAKVMSVLMRPMMKALVKECSADLDDLKKAAEA